MTDLAPAMSTLEVYESWAPVYPPTPHNPVMRAEQAAMLAALPDVRGVRALDLACGSGRYARLLADAGATDIIAADFSAAMLARVAVGRRVRADITELPFVSQCFDLVVSGLALGHAADLARCLGEIARVLKPGARLLYSDFDPAAGRAGLSRSFRDAAHRKFTVPPAPYEIDDHRAAAQLAGLRIDAVRELRVGREIREASEGSEEFYRRWHDVPLVFVIEARR